MLVIGDALLAAGVRDALGGESALKVVAETRSTVDAMEIARRLKPHVALIMPCACTADTPANLCMLQRNSPETKIVLFGDLADYPFERVAQLRVDGTICATVEPDQLAHALHRTVHGGDQAQAEVEFDEGAPSGLTDRELQVLAAVARGRTNVEIARALCVSEHTVKFHLRRIYCKLRLRSRAEAVYWLREQCTRV